MNTDWEMRFLSLAAHIAQWSKDPSTKCGAVIVREDKTIASLGFNGFPRGIEDKPLVLLDRDRKLERVIHAEMNALLFLKEPAYHYAMFVWPMLPCHRCAAHIIQAGISYIAAPISNIERWKDSIQTTKHMLQEANVRIVEFNIQAVPHSIMVRSPEVPSPAQTRGSPLP